MALVAVEFFLPLRAFGSAFHVAMNGASAGKKIISLLNTPDPVWGTEEVGGREIKLDNVTFSYDGKRDVLKNIEITFPERGMTAIVGESGCGKSTVVNMLVAVAMYFNVVYLIMLIGSALCAVFCGLLFGGYKKKNADNEE